MKLTKIRTLAACSIATIALLAGPLTVPAAASVSGNYEVAVGKYTNSARTSRHLAKVKHLECLDDYAEAQARRMAKRQRLYHQSLNPILQKCKLQLVGENVAYGYPSGKAVTAAWMRSPGHRANILTPQFRRIGIGAYRDSNGRWWVSQVLGTLR